MFGLSYRGCGTCQEMLNLQSEGNLFGPCKGEDICQSSRCLQEPALYIVPPKHTSQAPRSVLNRKESMSVPINRFQAGGIVFPFGNGCRFTPSVCLKGSTILRWEA